MKNYRPYIFFTLFTIMFSTISADTFAVRGTEKTGVTQGGKRKKNGRYKKKNGFFKRLFKGKNACDCPKYK